MGGLLEPCDDKILTLFIKEFIKHDKYCVLVKCSSWFYSRCRKPLLPLCPEDLLFKVLEDFYLGNRKCYIDSYQRFKNSVYFAVESELKKLFNIRKKNCISEESIENYFIPFINNDNSNEIEYTKEISCDDQYEKHEIIELIRGELIKKNSLEELKVFDEILKGGKRKEIADALKITERDVTNIEKRMFRRIKNKIKLY